MYKYFHAKQSDRFANEHNEQCSIHQSALRPPLEGENGGTLKGGEREPVSTRLTELSPAQQSVWNVHAEQLTHLQQYHEHNY